MRSHCAQRPTSLLPSILSIIRESLLDQLSILGGLQWKGRLRSPLDSIGHTASQQAYTPEFESPVAPLLSDRITLALVARRPKIDPGRRRRQRWPGKTKRERRHVSNDISEHQRRPGRGRKRVVKWNLD